VNISEATEMQPCIPVAETIEPVLEGVGRRWHVGVGEEAKALIANHRTNMSDHHIGY
jgi:hypothetical protein